MKHLLLAISICHSSLFAVSPSKFEVLCMKTQRPKGFDALISLNLNGGKPVSLGKQAECARLSAKAEKQDFVTVFEALEPLSSLEVFPHVKSLVVQFPEKLTQLSIGKHPHLTYIGIGADIQLESLGDLIYSPELSSIDIVGRGASSFVDLSDLVRLPKTREAVLGLAEIRHTEILKLLPEFISLFIRDAKLDRPLDPEWLKSLKVSTLKNVR